MIQLNLEPQLSFDNLNKNEWLETNGLGGWASSCLTGCNTRRYHGLLVAAPQYLANRMMLVSKLDETIVTGDRRIGLGTNDYGTVISPQGHWHLKTFSRDLYPSFLYEAEGIELRKSLLMVHGANTTVLKYEVEKAPQSFTLEFAPLLAVRDCHKLTEANGQASQEAVFENGQLYTQLYEGTPGIFIKLANGRYEHNPLWYYRFNYHEEQCRGLECNEDLLNPGTLSLEAREGDTIYVILSTDDQAGADAATLFAREVERRQALVGDEQNPVVRQLVLAADQFIVQKSEEQETIVAGYHWFTDYSRDVLIALPGLCLSTGRFSDARSILAAMARSVSEGQLPTRTEDDGSEPAYNNVDGALWLFVAAWKYLQASGDSAFVLDELLPVLTDILDWHYKGTRFNIHVDDDNLLVAGVEGVQLTWMDAAVNGNVITPRTGKPVEVQALWYNALVISSELWALKGQKKRAAVFAAEAQKVKDSFGRLFWNAEGNYYNDVVEADGRVDAALRPNQLLAVSLPFTLADAAKAKAVVKAVEEKLLTPKGLRSLSPDAVQYTPAYFGDPAQRDSSYHQGTVWSWLLGPYVDALLKVSATPAQKKKAAQVVEAFLPTLSEGGIGTVSEIYDAEAPHDARGAIAQAWSVGEALRVIREYGLLAPVAEKQPAAKAAAKPKAEAKPKAAAKPKAEAKPKAAAKAKPEAKPKAEAKAKTEAQPKAAAKAKAEAKPEVAAQPKAAAKPKAAKAKAEPKVEVVDEAPVEAKPKPKAKAQKKVDTV
ncbi:amylo-alpha-1,6-glucosidase [Paraflavisolibacter sp. H34]|uniref:amylo-alpha-1,6-glucosidase n=1 Tax=Huijunlia imazamoxiresistens TaxID=3127457 RepID=UPI003016D186